VLETVNLKKSLSKSAYQKAMPELQERLRKLQYTARAANVATIICLEGWDAAGKGAVMRKLTQKLDPRLFRVYAGTPPTPQDERYHFLRRYQCNLPNYGEMAMFVHGWYRRVLDERCDKLVKKSEWREAYQQINEFERWLSDDGQLIVKFWMHISRKKQRQRFKKLLADPNLAWRVTKDYRRHHRNYDAWLSAVEEMLAKTETSYAPWTVIEANDQHWALIRIFEVLAQRMQHELDRRSEKKPVSNQAGEMIDELPKEKPKKRSKRASGVNGRHPEQSKEAEASNA
jgi:polyphosphate kinase 2 (PPK2 family)